jgi:hypothetical protein
MERAVGLIDDWLHDFPFANAASRANAIAIPLTYVARELMGKTPLFVIDAPTQGRFGIVAESLARLFGTPQYLIGQTGVVVLWMIDPSV